MKKRTEMGIFLDKLYIFTKFRIRIIKASRYAKKRVKLIGGGYVGSSLEYKEKVLDYWKKYGVRPKKYWYQLFSSREKSFNPRYIPDSMWYGKILPYFNLLLFKRSYTDKGFYDVLFKDIKRPEMIIKNIAGLYYDGEGNLIEYERALELCRKEASFIAKPSLDSGSGRLIQFYDSKNMEISEIEKILQNLQSNYVVQRLVEQHEEISKLHAKSLNTIRIVSFHFKGEVHILSTLLRMGAGDSKVDNISAGGFACPINEDGSLNKFAVNRKSEWCEQHSGGAYFADIKVPSFSKVIDIIKIYHKQLPYFRIIGWDFAIDKYGEPVFIEYNVSPEPNQITCGPTFGDLTEDVLEEVFINKKLEKVMN